MFHSEYVIPMRLFVVLEVLEVQDVPLSDDVSIVPELPITTNVSSPYAMLCRRSVVPEVLDVHDDPLSEDVKIVPDSPTDTKVLFPNVTPFNA